MKRCDECGSWDKCCASETPVHDCRCARCASAQLSAVDDALDEFSPRHTKVSMAESVEMLRTRLCQVRADALKEREELVAALRECVQQYGEDDHKPCWCQLPYMVPYRGHDAGCEMARAALEKYK